MEGILDIQVVEVINNPDIGIKEINEMINELNFGCGNCDNIESIHLSDMVSTSFSLGIPGDSLELTINEISSKVTLSSSTPKSTLKQQEKSTESNISPIPNSERKLKTLNKQKLYLTEHFDTNEIKNK